MGKKHGSGDWDQGENGSRNQRQYAAAQEDLHEYIRVCRPGIVIVVIALLVLFTAVIVWGVVGTLPVTETVTGLVVDRDRYLEAAPETAGTLLEDLDDKTLVLCFVDASRYNGQAIKEFGEGAVLKMADQSTYTGEIEVRYMIPMSMEQAGKLLLDNEWVIDRCVRQDYNWMLIIHPDEDLSQYAFTLTEVTLLTEEVAPIRFLMK